MYCSKCRCSFAELIDQTKDKNLMHFPKCHAGGQHDFTNQVPAEAAITTHHSPYLIQ